jgi:uncharacterized protein (DUF362 family)/Pyruvate/2-oxoacid:ferredoxin oxidoreductase delta subunit
MKRFQAAIHPSSDHRSAESKTISRSEKSPRQARSVVAASPCPDYEYGKVEVAVKAVLDPLGGIREFVKRGDTVLLKVNLLAAKAPERAITTHPVVLEAVAREVISAGGKIVVGDSPAGVLNGINRFWEATGIGETTEKVGGELIRFEGSGTNPLRINGKVYHISSILQRVDKVINLPKLKTHGLTLFTGAIKNCFGLLPGFQKANLHKAAPKIDAFSEILVDIYSRVNPVLNIMDAVVGLEGNGPSSNGSARKIGLMMASPDAVALDAVASRIIGFKSEDIATTKIAHQKGLGEGRFENIGLFGPPLSDISVPDYRLPSNSLLRIVPSWLAGFAGRFFWVHPKAVADNCQQCGICIENCPMKCMTPDATGVPSIDHDACINCLCCDESCPHDAIIQELSWLARKLQ